MPAGLSFVVRSDAGERVERLLLAPQPGPSGKYFSPVLGLSFVYPQQAAAHRGIVIGRPEALWAHEVSVPRMGVFMRQHPTPGHRLVPAGEILGRCDVLARTMVLE